MFQSLDALKDAAIAVEQLLILALLDIRLRSSMLERRAIAFRLAVTG